MNDISGKVITCSYEVQRTLGGPGLLESIYEEALVWELQNQGLKVERQVHLPISYKGQNIGHPLIMDLVIEDNMVVECKATSQFNKVFEAQLLTYLRLSQKKLGLIINFGEPILKNGIHRVVNGL